MLEMIKSKYMEPDVQIILNNTALDEGTLQLTLSLLELHTCTGLCKFMDKELRETRARGQKPKSRWDSRNSSLINLQSIVLNYVANADGIFLPTHV